MIKILKGCEKELKEFPITIKEDLADALAKLEEGLKLSMPLSRPMPSVAPGAHELRLRDRSGIYRVIYVFIVQNDIFLVHAFKKKTQTTPLKNISVARKRIGEALK